MNGSSSFITLSVYVMGHITAERPPTSTKFNMSAPMMFPRERDECFFLRAVNEVASSGREVPSAMKVRDMMDSGTLKTRAKELDRYARLSASALGAELEELPEWQCCGAVYPMAKDEIATRLSAVRALMSARDLGTTLVTVCSACHNVLKRANEDLKADENFRTKVNNYVAPEVPYAGEAKVIHYLEMLRDEIGFDAVKEKVVNSFKGKKIAAYYGCLLLRPGKVMAFDDPENPRVIEDFIASIGATPVLYGQRNECCGAYVTLEDKAQAQKSAKRILDSAKAAGAEMIVTACPLCMYNLTANAPEGAVPVKYFTELLAEALGVKEVQA